MLATTSGIMNVNEEGEFTPEIKVSGEATLNTLRQIKALLPQLTKSPFSGLN